MNLDRLTQERFDALILAQGDHDVRSNGLCAMEAVAWLAGEKHTDHPACVSSVLGAFLRRWNDDLDDTDRQRLKPYLARTIGTAGDGHEETRGWIVTDWMIRTYLPAWLELAGIERSASALRALPGITRASLSARMPALKEAQTKAAAAGVAAWAAARAAAGAAAWDAARDAARAAAGVAAWDAAGVAAWDAARDAAGAAAWAAARDAAGAAARAAAGVAVKRKLHPTVKSLQASAFELLDRIIDPERKNA